MPEGTRLGKIESELARIETEMRLDKEQRKSFQDRIESQLSKMMDMIEKNGTNRDNHEDNPLSLPLMVPLQPLLPAYLTETSSATSPCSMETT